MGLSDSSVGIYFNAEEGSEAEVHCRYKAFPAPKSVKWFKGGSQIHNNENYEISSDVKGHSDRTILTIKNVDKDDLITYECEVEASWLILQTNPSEFVNNFFFQNDLGLKRQNVTLGFAPAPADFSGYKYINNIVYTDWIIKSHQQLTELQILYRNHEVSEATNVWIEIYGLITNYLTEWMATEKRSNYQP